MSRNLATDRCVRCNVQVDLSDLAGAPIEFRVYPDDLPRIGARWDCPTCGMAYFAHWRTRGDCISCHINHRDQEPTWEIDLSFWSTYNDELPVLEDPVEAENVARGFGVDPAYEVVSGCEHQRFYLS